MHMHIPSSSWWEGYSPLQRFALHTHGQSEYWFLYTIPSLQQVSGEGELIVLTHAVQKEIPHDHTVQSKAPSLCTPLPPVSTRRHKTRKVDHITWSMEYFFQLWKEKCQPENRSRLPGSYLCHNWFVPAAEYLQPFSLQPTVIIYKKVFN